MNDNIITPINLPRMRLLDECVDELKKLDPNTAITKYYIRQLAISGKIPTVKCGRKRLINLDGLIKYISMPQAQNADTGSGIRKIV